LPHCLFINTVNKVPIKLSFVVLTLNDLEQTFDVIEDTTFYIFFLINFYVVDNFINLVLLMM